MTIEIDTSDPGAPELLEKMAEALRSQVGQAVTPAAEQVVAAETGAHATGAWAPGPALQNMRALAGNLTENACRVLRQMAEDNLDHGESVGREIREKPGLQVTPMVLGTWVGSIKRQAGHLVWNKPYTLMRRNNGAVYFMARHVAEAVLAVIGPDGKLT